MIEILDFRTATHDTGLGVSAEPRLSWRYSSLGSGPLSWMQTSYDIEIQRTNGSTLRRLITVNGASSASVAWPDSPLSSRERASVRVRAHGSETTKGLFQNGPNISTPWSPWLLLEAALLSQDDFVANFITSTQSPAKAVGESYLRPIRVRKCFKVNDAVYTRARLYVTALGLYVAYLNGKRVGEEQMAPGYTSYHHRIQYQVYDVTDLIRSGSDNVLAIEVAEGWYAGRISWDNCARSLYGDEIGTLAQLELFTDKSNNPGLTIKTDGSWLSMLSPILSSGIWPGETYDRRKEMFDWNKTASTDANLNNWFPVKTMAAPAVKLEEATVAGVKLIQIIKPVAIFRSASGKTIVDFGQNIAGKVRVHRLKRHAGHTLQLRHAEALESGEIATRPLRSAKATDTVIFGSDDELVDWSPQFTYHGFRYTEVYGWGAEDEDDPLTVDSISALVMHTDMDRTGYFNCSNELLNKLHENVVWSMRSNFVSIPTDCPQRDERMGWTGDIQVFARTATFLYDCGLMLSNWMQDLTCDQKDANGVVPLVAPNCLAGWKWPSVAQAIWDDVVILLPWILYLQFGNSEVLQQNYSSMQDHIDRSIPRGADGLWDESAWQLGDWLDPNAPPQEPGLSRTDGTLVADEYLVYVTCIMAKISQAIGYSEEATRYRSEYDRLTEAFQEKYMAPSGLVVGDSQTSLALALNFSLHRSISIPNRSRDQRMMKQRAVASDRLSRLVRYAKFRVSTGFAGTPAVLHALSSTGHLQDAYRMLLETSCPSWLYAVTMGSTTIWERWDSLLPDGSVNPGTMTSFNHYALGAVADWMHKVIGGIVQLSDHPGWRKFAVYPRPGGDVTSCRTEFKSPCGWIRSDWRIDAEESGQLKFKLRLEVPPNSIALVVLPSSELIEDIESNAAIVGSGYHKFEREFRPEGVWPPKALLTEWREAI